MTITYAAAHDLLEAYCRARMTYDGDAFTALFTEDAEVTLDPFNPALVGANALRAYLLEAAETEGSFDLAVERHWVAADTVLAAWHASWNPGGDATAKTRQAGFLSAEVGEDGRIARLKLWAVTREHLAGREGA
jgi:ketosteroid isomerase-like protein